MKKSMKTTAITWALLAASCEYVNALESKSTVQLKAHTEAKAKVETKAESKVESKVKSESKNLSKQKIKSEANLLDQATNLLKTKSKSEQKGEAKYWGDGFINAAQFDQMTAQIDSEIPKDKQQ